MSALQENACLKRMTPSPPPSDTAVVKAFAGIPGLLEQAPALIARGRGLDCEWQGRPGAFKGDLYFYRVDGDRRYIAPVLSEILKHSTTSTKQGAHV
jgi:hypothetical protein